MADVYNVFDNLPGIRVRTNFDWKKDVSTNTANTEAVLILGTAKDGPKDPYRLLGASESDIYGSITDAVTDAEKKSHVIHGILEAKEAGCNDIWVMRISGTEASLSVNDTGSILQLQALYAGEKYGNPAGSAGLGVIITEDRIYLKDLNGNIKQITFQDGITSYSQLVETINSVARETKVKAAVRDNVDPYQAITSYRPAVIEGTEAGPYNIDSSNNVLFFTSIDGDTNGSTGHTITLTGTSGSVSNVTATTSKYFLYRGVNDILNVRASSMSAGTYEQISLLNTGQTSAWFTGAELATRMASKLNANSAVTNSGANTITTSFSLSATPFSVAISSGTLNLDYELSTAADTIGMTSDKAGATILSDADVKFNIMANCNDRFVIREDGRYTRDIAVESGYYTAATLETAINSAIGNAYGTATCDYSAGIFTFTSDKAGNASSIALADGATTFLPIIGFDGATTTVAGTGFARFIDEATAREVADAITAGNTKLAALPFTNASGVTVVKIYSMAKGTGQLITGANNVSTINLTLGIEPSTTYNGQAGNLPVTLPTSNASSWTFKYMSGGEDKLTLTNDELLDALATAYSNIEDLEGIDYLVPMGAYIFVNSFGQVDFKHASNVARCAHRRSVLGNFTHGIVAIEPITNPSIASVNARVAYWKDVDMSINLMSDYYTTTSTPTVELALQNGAMAPVSVRNLLSIDVGPEFVFSQPLIGPYVSTGCAAYAGRASCLPANSATTEKKIGGPLHLYYKYGKSALNDLVGARYLTFYEDLNSGVKTVLDITYDLDGATYDNLMTFRIMATIVGDQGEIFKPYIGEAVNAQNINAIGAECQRYLDGLKNTGFINNFEFKLVVPPGVSRMGQIFIYQKIETPQELKRFTIVNTLSNKF